MHMSKRTIAYVGGNSCRDVESIHVLSNAALFGKEFALVCFVVWLKLCIYVGHWESCSECTVVAFLAEATLFGFGKNRVWYLL